MKKFQFSLAAVQRYKDQMLDLAKQDYAAAQARVAAQEEKIALLRQQFREENEKLKAKNREGTNVLEINSVKDFLIYLQEQIDSEVISLAKLENEAEGYKDKMVAANVEVKSLETLYDHQLEAYNAAAAKKEAESIEEFVSVSKYSN